MTPGEYRIEIETPAGRRRGRARIVVRDGTGRILTTACADLMDAAGRRGAARDLCRSLGGDPEELARLLEQKWAEALTAAEQAPAEPDSTPPGPRYHDTEGYLALVRPTRDGDVTIPLANWMARIREQTLIDDGAERRITLAIEGQLADGSPLPRADVAARDFPWMRWPVEVWGTRAVVHAGAAVADHARAAIQLLSGDVPTRTVYAHTGWREVDGQWVYLNGAGGIGPAGIVPGIEVQLPDALAGYVLPAPPQGPALVEAVRASLGILDLGPDRITVPLLGSVYRAVLGPADYTLHLSGPTGCYKTEAAALPQQHFGAGLDARHLPGSWASTGNSLEVLAHAAADALLAVDDFAPNGSTADVQRMHREADRLLRAQGNRAGRGRLRPDGTLRPVRPPRCTILSTGEDVPRGQSLRARMLVLEIAPGDLGPPPPAPNTALTACQRDAAAGQYAMALAGFLRWLAPQYPAVRDGLRAETAALRERFQAEGQHARTPAVLADLAAGWRWLLDYAQAVGAIDQAERERLDARVWSALLAVGAEQAEQVQAAEPAQHYLRLLAAALASGRAHVAGPDGGAPSGPAAWGWREVEFPTREGLSSRWDPLGRRVGWLDGGNLYLEPEAAYAEVQELARHQAESLSISARTLRKRLSQQKLLASTGTAGGRKTLTIRRVLEGQRREVLHLQAAVLSAAQLDQPDHDRKTAGGDGQVDGQVAPNRTPNLTTDLTTNLTTNAGEKGTTAGNGQVGQVVQGTDTSRAADFDTGDDGWGEV
jgi:hypothetical protein